MSEERKKPERIGHHRMGNTMVTLWRNQKFDRVNITTSYFDPKTQTRVKKTSFTINECRNLIKLLEATIQKSDYEWSKIRHNKKLEPAPMHEDRIEVDFKRKK